MDALQSLLVQNVYHKVCDVKQKCQNMQIKLEQYCSVMRYMELSPACRQHAKRSAGKSREEGSAKQLLFGETSTEFSKSDQQKFLENSGPSSIINNTEELSTPMCDSQHQDDDENNLGGEKSWKRGCLITLLTLPKRPKFEFGPLMYHVTFS